MHVIRLRKNGTQFIKVVIRKVSSYKCEKREKSNGVSFQTITLYNSTLILIVKLFSIGFDECDR